ncbi:restriction endonuclease subunit S [Enterococcus faecium]|uniref:restriction endonuclease subunit S n=1 Tax=Enterococcus faecium TaxID=1352 RepID=UPI000CF2BB41|nr:restriction endonuclease subunit S [Enterococcus faecium]EGP5370876.1 restriction endonuclease subunit S [Enterococcus faecium]PQD92692.1 restriction endonuclease subunit S [Enterococcus faecium]
MSNDTQPEIRFPGFTEDWEQRKLSELATMNARIGWQNLRTSEFLDKGDYMLITGTDFKDGAIDYSNIHYVERERFEQDKKIQISNGSILITKDGTLGKVAYVEGLTMPATLNAGVFNVRVKENLAIDSRYLFHYLKAPFLLKFADQRSTGGTIKHLNQNVLVEFPIPLPSLEEQHKVAGLLSNFDNTIALHQRKLDLLKETKKGFLQKMFPKNGAKVPEIRFPGFTEDWEQRKLGELATIVRGASPRPIQDPKWFDTESDVGWLRIADVTEQDGRIYYLEQHISKLGQEKTRVLVEPHLLLSIAATVGKPVVNYVKTGVHDGFLIFLNAIFDREFMFQWLEMFRPKWQKYGQPGSQVNLNSELVRNQEILIPNNEEQQKIGSFFKQLDDTIALHQRELDVLKETKKGFLQKMFV